MKIYTTKALILTIFTLWLGLFGVSPGYALTLNETEKLLASDGEAGDIFGVSVSISENTAVIGTRSDESAYVFVRDGSGNWSEQQKLTASDGAVQDQFGISVSISGDTAVIGAQLNNDNGRDSGSAYVFVRNGTGMWSEQQKLNASDGSAGDFFGGSVSISGNTAVIGASESNADKGSATVFVRDGAGVWSEQQKLTASDGADDDDFGISVSLSGDTAVIGAYLDDDNGDRSGSVYVFIRDGTGVWSMQQKLTASDGAVRDFFGYSVSLSGDTAVIGARGDDDKGNVSGSAYVFVRNGAGVWSEQQKLVDSDGSFLDEFGWSVSISGDLAVIGSSGDDTDSGSAIIFFRDGTVWSEQQKLTASDGVAYDELGKSVSLSGDTVVIGAMRDDDNGDASGSAYVFETSDPNNDLLTLEKLINHRLRETANQAAQLLAGTRYRADYKVTNNSPNRIYRIQVFESAKLVCNLYALDPGESRRGCARNQPVLSGIKNVPATVTAKLVGSSETLVGQSNAYYNGHSDMPGKLSVTHYVNEKNADTQATAVTVNSNQAEVKFRIENTGSIELYLIRTYHDPASPINSGWQEQCFIGTLMPGQIRYCTRTINVTQADLNKAFGRAQGLNANVNPKGFVNAANPTYFNVVLP